MDKSTKLLFASYVIFGTGAGLFRLSSCNAIFNSTGIFCWSQVSKKLIKLLTKSSATWSSTYIRHLASFSIINGGLSGVSSSSLADGLSGHMTHLN